MNGLITWLLGFTKMGKLLGPILRFFDGYKAYLAGLAIALPALGTMAHGVAQGGTGYLSGVVGSPEWHSLMEGWAVIALRAGISKAVTKAAP